MPDPTAGPSATPAPSQTAPPSPNVVEFPTAPSSTTDQSAAITSFLAANKGKTVGFQPGTYRVDVRIQLNSWSGTILGRGAVFRRFATDPGRDAILRFVASTDITLDHLSIRGPATLSDVTNWTSWGREDEHALYLDSVKNARILGGSFTNTWGDGVYIRERENCSGTYCGPSDGVSIEGATFDTNGRNGVSLTNARNVSIVDSFFANSGLANYDAEPNRSTDVIEHIAIRGNDFRSTNVGHTPSSSGAGYHIYASAGVRGSDDVTIDANTFERGTIYAVGPTRNHGLVITDNRADQPGTTTIAHTDGLVISGNVNFNISVSDSTYGTPPTPPPPTPTSPPPPASGFVQRSGTHLTLDGQPYDLTGLNIYNANSRNTCWYTPDLGTDLDSSGVKNFRAWFPQGLATTNGVRDWSVFDQTFATARSRGVHVIAVLSVEDCKGDGPESRLTPWLTSGYRTVIAAGHTVPFRQYAAEFAARYRNETALAVTQIGNEWDIKNADGTCGPAATLKAFADDVAAVIKAADPNHLVSFGTIGSGQCGAQGSLEYRALHAGPNIDLCEYHDYGFPNDPMPNPANTSNNLTTRIADCASLNKPLFVGEAGISMWSGVTNCSTVGTTVSTARPAQFAAKVTAQRDAGSVGFIAWEYRAAGKTGGDPCVLPAGDPALGALRP